MTLVTVDLGNSRCKLCAWSLPGATFSAEELPELVRRADLDSHAETLSSELEAWAREVGRSHPVRGALVCSVASAGRTARVAEGLVRALGTAVPVTVDPESGLENRCRRPETVGADRLFAARGAVELVGGSCLVVDAGTAVTVDAVLAARGARSAGAFLGGAIAPGPALLARALGEGTDHLPRVTPATARPALGRETEEALLAGIDVGFRGAVRELVERIRIEADLPAAPVVLSGGARDHLLEPEPVFAGELLVHAELVHLGLLAASGDAGASVHPGA